MRPRAGQPLASHDFSLPHGFTLLKVPWSRAAVCPFCVLIKPSLALPSADFQELYRAVLPPCTDRAADAQK